MKWVFLVPIMLVLFSINCLAQTNNIESISSVDAFLKSILKGKDELSLEARGDLDSDGLADWAGVVRREKPDQSGFTSRTAQLYVLLRQGQGGYRIAEQTEEEVFGGMGCCWVEDLKIRRSSIYLKIFEHSVDSKEETTYQFKLYKGEWQLIGLRIFYVEIEPGGKPVKSIETDMNLLTGAVIEKRQKGKRKPVIKRRQEEFPIYLLEEFDFDYSSPGIE